MIMIGSWSVLICLPACIAAKTYLKVETDLDGEWAPNILAEYIGLNTTIECASMCSLTPECGSFKYKEDNSSCILANKYVMCVGGAPSSSQTVTIHLGLPSEEDGVQPYMVSSMRMKSSWEATASSNYSSWWEKFYPGNAIDGPTGSLWANSGNHYAWLKIKMDRERWVLGIAIKSRSNFLNRAKYTEIRVGNTDIPDDEPEQLPVLCHNQLCYMITNTDTTNNYFDCMTPLRGQYITFQRNSDLGDRYMDVEEVDVLTFCGIDDSFIEILNHAECPPVELDSCANRELITTSTQLASTAAQKSSWTLTASSNYDDTRLSLDSIIDGNKAGTLEDDNIYITGSQGNTPDEKYPWIQVDLGESKVVKAVHMYSRNDDAVGENILYTEVRVGETNAAEVTQLGSRICVNAVCKNTGGGTAMANQKHDCSGGSPIQGRYVIMQRHNFKKQADGSIWKGALAMAEVDIEFYV